MRSDMKRVVAALIGSLTLAGCGGAKAAGSATAEQAAEAKYSDITAHQLHQKMQAKDFVLVNVHVPYAGDIPGTDLSIPFDRIVEQADRLPPDRAAGIVLYCRSGHMSSTASAALASLGYTRVFNLTGGMRAWEAEGYPLEHRAEP